jgi:hypothetical protein
MKPREIPDFYMDLQNGVWKDDGDNTVTVHLDCGKLFPGERPPELLDAARQMMDRYRDSDDAPKETEDAPPDR